MYNDNANYIYRGGYNQRVLSQSERDEARSLLNLNTPFIQSRRRNANSGEGAREEVCIVYDPALLLYNRFELLELGGGC
jgi:hypothetical protein